METPLVFYKRIPLHGAVNVRDMGGYQTSAGGVTKWKTVLRGSQLQSVDEFDVSILYDYGIRTVIDLRCDFEVEHNINFEQKGITYTNLPLLDNYDNINSDYYVHMVDNCKDNIKQIFEYISERLSYGGIIYNCVLGRDRTGVISALLMLLCGVSDLDVIADYMVTAIYLKPFAKKHNRTVDDISSDAVRMEYFIKYLKNNYSGAKNYLKHIGVSPEAIKNIKKNFIIKISRRHSSAG